jgi:L-serine dehydratase
MAVSTFDLFTIGIGPSSSHTVGPMRAARMFVEGLATAGVLTATATVRVELFGSLGLTGRGHGSDRAVLLGLEGAAPETVDPDTISDRVDAITAAQRITLAGAHPIDFDPSADLVFHLRERLPAHPNGIRMTAWAADGTEVAVRTYYSVGGGFVLDEAAASGPIQPDETPLPLPFTTAGELLDHCDTTGWPISRVMLENEKTWRDEAAIRDGLVRIWDAMRECVRNGCAASGVLPGGLSTPRRAGELHRQLSSAVRHDDPLETIDWVNLYALAVNEENAAGGRVVTAPTNGAAGIIPAVLHYYDGFVPGADTDGVVRFLLTAAAIGIIIKATASISGAEVGCQGEVGSACAMAAGALAEVQGGSPRQVENAAEIGLEHNLGLTCDPVGGLVQIPCIERNAIGAVKALNAARMALHGDGSHKVSLDKAVRTLRDTGADMSDKYKETSRGGLAVNVIEC